MKLIGGTAASFMVATFLIVILENSRITEATVGLHGPDRYEGIPEECLIPMEVGYCRAKVKRYYFDLRRMKCSLFFWGGCAGNVNNFKTMDECTKFCLNYVDSDYQDNVPSSKNNDNDNDNKSRLTTLNTNNRNSKSHNNNGNDKKNNTTNNYDNVGDAANNNSKVKNNNNSKTFNRKSSTIDEDSSYVSEEEYDYDDQ